MVIEPLPLHPYVYGLALAKRLAGPWQKISSYRIVLGGRVRECAIRKAEALSGIKFKYVCTSESRKSWVSDASYPYWLNLNYTERDRSRIYKAYFDADEEQRLLLLDGLLEAYNPAPPNLRSCTLFRTLSPVLRDDIIRLCEGLDIEVGKGWVQNRPGRRTVYHLFVRRRTELDDRPLPKPKGTRGRINTLKTDSRKETRNARI